VGGGAAWEVVVATHAAVLPAGGEPVEPDAISARFFSGHTLIGAAVAGAAVALTDFPVQRLLEIDTYRMLALLALPVARELSPVLTGYERELAEITTALTDVGEADSHYRFSAAAAYHDLVTRRIEELREERVPGLQTFGEFTGRRLAPAMNTCRATAARQESLSERVARTTQLLSTRVDVARACQNQAVLEQMNRRTKLQLRLQQTVEGLSVAAITYYIVALTGYAAKGLNALHQVSLSRTDSPGHVLSPC
jgi:uncharacterized membrane-anchored protein